MANRISHSAVRLYSQCGKRYDLHYNKKLRPNVISGALLFGSAIDAALNDLLINKDIEKAKTVFLKAFEWQTINGVQTNLPKATNIVYAKTDYDSDLVGDINSIYEPLSKKKQESGFDSLTQEEKTLYSNANWNSMCEKGLIMIDTYAREILPQINKVLAVQKNIALKNDAGDEIIAYVDLIVEWKDGKRYILDNKTSTRDYDPDSASKSQQLLLYHHICKDEYKIDGGIGFIVLYKQIQKNRKKICSVCEFDGSGARHKTCNNEVSSDPYKEPSLESWPTKRCNGEWKQTIDPKARIEVILNQPKDVMENLVLDSMDGTNEAIKAGIFTPNLQACGDFNSDYRCPYYNLCHEGKDDSLVKV